MVRKDFCCKKLLENFVHRMMASGIYHKHWNDKVFLSRLSFLSTRSKNDSSQRKLTLTDVALAFLFLTMGYFISVLILIGEILANRRMNVKKKEKYKRKNTHREDLL